VTTVGGPAVTSTLWVNHSLDHHDRAARGSAQRQDTIVTSRTAGGTPASKKKHRQVSARYRVLLPVYWPHTRHVGRVTW
jgi:hypothetical protein